MSLLTDITEREHQIFLNRRYADGWKYGNEFSKELKTDPRIIPFDEYLRRKQVAE